MQEYNLFISVLPLYVNKASSFDLITAEILEEITKPIWEAIKYCLGLFESKRLKTTGDGIVFSNLDRGS